MTAKNNFGNALFLSAVGGTLVKVADASKIGPPKLSRGTNDITTHESPGGAMQFQGEGTYDPGEMSVDILYSSLSAGDAALRGYSISGETVAFQLLEKGSGIVEVEGLAIVTEYGPDEYDTKGVQTASISLKITGQVARALA